MWPQSIRLFKYCIPSPSSDKTSIRKQENKGIPDTTDISLFQPNQRNLRSSVRSTQLVLFRERKHVEDTKSLWRVAAQREHVQENVRQPNPWKPHSTTSSGAIMMLKHQLRLDAGEVIDGKKNVYLQVNGQAKNEALKKYR